MRRLQFGIAATQSLGLPQTAERRCRGLGAFFWLLGSAGSGNTYSLWDHQNRADPGLGLVVADTANVPSRPQNMVVAAFLEKDLFFNRLLGMVIHKTRYTITADESTTNQINLVVSSGAGTDLSWRGTASAAWDVAGSTNWLNTSTR